MERILAKLVKYSLEGVLLLPLVISVKLVEKIAILTKVVFSSANYVDIKDVLMLECRKPKLNMEDIREKCTRRRKWLYKNLQQNCH